MAAPAPLNISLFELLRRELDENDIPTIQCTKATLVHLSHTLEDMVLRYNLPALMFTGFQESTYWKQETARYRQLADVAQQICIFAGRPLPPESKASELHIELASGDMLRQEWFVLIMADEFNVLLCGQDNLKETYNEATRQFETIWSFQPEIINRALDMLDGVIEHYRPEKAKQLREARKKYPPGPINSALITDLTRELVHYEEQLNHKLSTQRQLTDTLLKSISHYVYISEVNAAGDLILTYLSPNTQYLFGEAVSVKNDWHFLNSEMIHPDDRGIIQSHIQALKNGVNHTVEYRLVQDDGTRLWLRDNGQVVNNQGGRQQIYGVLEDITIEKEVEIMRREQEELRLAVQKERELNDIKNYFMTTVSHEFRTPLATILSSSELLLRYSESLDPERQKDKIQQIRTQVMHLSKMLDDIELTISEQSKELGLNPTPLDPGVFFQEIIDEFRTANQAQHLFTFEMYGEAGDVLVDRKLLRSILVNLISNAVKYSEPGSQITCRLTVDTQKMIFSITDQGIGIPEEDHALIFDSFHRGGNIGNRSGMGLGLKIARDYVQIHEGRINFTTQEGVGTTFNVYIPVRRPEE